MAETTKGLRICLFALQFAVVAAGASVFGLPDDFPPLGGIREATPAMDPRLLETTCVNLSEQTECPPGILSMRRRDDNVIKFRNDITKHPAVSLPWARRHDGGNNERLTHLSFHSAVRRGRGWCIGVWPSGRLFRPWKEFARPRLPWIYACCKQLA
ncbi:hypothetical protein MRX96_016055 [Rhipicephalus microplus]